MGLYEQTVEFGPALVNEDDGKAGHRFHPLGNENLATLDVLEGKLDRFRIGFELLPVFGNGESGPVLQLFEIQAFIRPRLADPDREVSEP